MDHTSDVPYRFFDVAGEHLQRLPPLKGFENLPVVSLEEATQPLIPHVPELKRMVDIAYKNDVQSDYGLTADESSSIALYTVEWSPPKNSFYIILNETLRNSDREKLLPPWLLFLKLFMTALSKLPQTGTRTIYRGVNLDLMSKYRQGTKIVWWGFSSCTTNAEVLENNLFLDKNSARTIFTIECDTGKDIRKHSYYQKEDEILLIPGIEFEVVSSMNMGDQHAVIQLKEASESKPVLQPVKISYKDKYLTDAKVERIIKEALMKKKCTELDLTWNDITHTGAGKLAKALQNNKVKKYVLKLGKKHIFPY